jgi:hypothetical protein
MCHFNKNSACADFLIFFAFEVDDSVRRLQLGEGGIYDAFKHS